MQLKPQQQPPRVKGVGPRFGAAEALICIFYFHVSFVLLLQQGSSICATAAYNVFRLLFGSLKSLLFELLHLYLKLTRVYRSKAE